MTKNELKKKNRNKMAKKTRKEQQRAGIFKKKTQKQNLACHAKLLNNIQKLRSFLFGKMNKFSYICIN